MAKKRKRSKKEKELQRKLEALKANQKVLSDTGKQKTAPTNDEPVVKRSGTTEIYTSKKLDDAIIITDDKHIKQDLLRTTIFTVLTVAVILALKYYHPLI